MGAIAQADRLARFPELSYRAFAYPGDEEALENLKRVPGVPRLFHWLLDNVVEEYSNLSNLYNNTRVSMQSYPSVQRMVEDCCRTLDCPVPEVFVSYGITYNAYTSGVDRTYITLHSELLDSFSEEEIRFVIGHELGHIKSGHVLYKSVALFIIRNMHVLRSILPVDLGLLKLPVLVALSEWYRRAEFSCDRAGLLCVQDQDAALGALSRFAGKLERYPGEQSLDSLDEQLDDVRDSPHKLVKAMLFLDSLHRTHPYPVQRIQQLRQWAVNGNYQLILRGEYQRDADGEHELGRRLACPGCKAVVNSKLADCPRCGYFLKLD
jgi:Zn-dependent protease with chaperone function